MIVVIIVAGILAGSASCAPLDDLRSLTVEPESDCGRPYARYRREYDAYRADTELEGRIVISLGDVIYSPYGRPHLP